jgi:hypothetical protein
VESGDVIDKEAMPLIEALAANIIKMANRRHALQQATAHYREKMAGPLEVMRTAEQFETWLNR